MKEKVKKKVKKEKINLLKRVLQRERRYQTLMYEYFDSVKECSEKVQGNKEIL
jgi:hypothetical protein